MQEMGSNRNGRKLDNKKNDDNLYCFPDFGVSCMMAGT
jgi:hypothetical protein